ncbi:uncharacterized protein LOC131690763 [Topomyia yanbarensis]|uniref:uncharacterized protein LOC131690763 n=1 Tax=Topomyia yanbarensis TaxID=2498891 RepID=UPI00273C72FD|nr:uncharacterized protein LOC131690763 [Topomyia yanbarensis]
MANTIPIYTIHNSFQLLAEPVHFPFSFGNENFIVTQQDQRNILDRRTWFLSTPVSTLSTIPGQNLFPASPDQLSLQQLLHQLATILSMHQHCSYPQQGKANPFNFHYEKQTSTDDLPYYLRKSGFDEAKPGEPPVVRHFHYVLNGMTRDMGVNTDGAETFGNLGTGNSDFWNPWKRAACWEEGSVLRPAVVEVNKHGDERMDCEDLGENTNTTSGEDAYCLMKKQKEKNVRFW